MPTCAGQLHGHDFPYTGANCSNCGVNQGVLSGVEPEKRSPPAKAFAGLKLERKTPPRGIYTELQLLVLETRTRFGETATKGKGSFGFYMGFFQRLGIETVRMFLADLKDVSDPKRLFWWKIGAYYKEKRAKKEKAA